MRSQRHSGGYSPQAPSGVFSPHSHSKGRARGTPGSPIGGKQAYSEQEYSQNNQQMRYYDDMPSQNTYMYEGQRGMYTASEERANMYSSPQRGYDGYQYDEYQSRQQPMADVGYPSRDVRHDSGRDVDVRASPPEGALDYWN
jgi:hypothetical protein